MRTHADTRQTQILVERLRALVGKAHLKRHLGGTQIARIGGNEADELASDAAATIPWIGGDL